MKAINIFAAAIATLLSIGASSQTRLSLEECVALATSNNAGLRAAQGEVDKARIMQGTAWKLDNTTLTLSQDPTSGGSPDNSLTLSQEFDFPTVYTSRRKSLKAETAVAQSRRDISAKQLAANVAEVYTLMVCALEREGIIRSQDSILTEYLHLATTRYKAGEARQLEKLRAGRMLSDNRLEADKVKAEFRSLQGRMRALTGGDADILPADSVLHVMPFSAPRSLDYSRTAESLLYTNEAQRAQRAVAEAKGGYLPNFSVGLRTQLVLKGWNPYNVDRSSFSKGDFMGFEVGVGFPLFFGSTKAKVRAAQKDRELTALLARQTMARQEGEYLAQREKLLSAQRRIDYYRNEGLSEAREMMRIAKVSYENSDIGYVEYIQAMLEAMNTRLKYAEAVKEYNLAVISLKELME